MEREDLPGISFLLGLSASSSTATQAGEGQASWHSHSGTLSGFVATVSVPVVDTGAKGDRAARREDTSWH